MLDIKYIREHSDVIREASVRKGLDASLVDALLRVDAERRELIQRIEHIRAEQKRATDREAATRLKEEFKKAQGESRIDDIEKEFSRLMALMPNVISPDTPEGKSEADNKEVYRWGEPAAFDFPAKDHIALGKALDILDFERGTKVGGFRGYYLKNEGVLLAMGIMLYAVRKMVEKGYTPMIPPTLVKEFALFGSGYFKGTEYDPDMDEIYEIATHDKESTGERSKDRKFLIGTAEPSLLAYYSDEVLKKADLPIRMAGYSQCYRSEIGSYGRDVKGMYRVHEFMKVEQVVLSEADPEKANALQDEMTALSGAMHEELGLRYRRLQMCAGDLGAGKYRQFDIEAWLPGMQRWAETGSASNFLDWQARRLNVKYTDGNDKKYVYMVNNTALPSPRIFIAILENYQTKEGKIRVPDVLQKYIGKDVIG